MPNPQRYLNHKNSVRSLDLYVEAVESGACMAHIPSLPGFCFCTKVDRNLEAEARRHLEAYAAWLEDHRCVNLTQNTAKIARCRSEAVPIREAARVNGAPVWESGNAAALFSIDHRVLSDDEVRATFRFVRLVLDDIRFLVEPLPSDRRELQPAPKRRSLNETLQHIGNCIWWYASRIDDTLPEPPDIDAEDPLDRIDRLFEFVLDSMLCVTATARQTVSVPKRYPTRDPSEPWTHAKACRREAEHVWAHLSGVRRDVAALGTERSPGDTA